MESVHIWTHFILSRAGAGHHRMPEQRAQETAKGCPRFTITWTASRRATSRFSGGKLPGSRRTGRFPSRGSAHGFMNSPAGPSHQASFRSVWTDNAQSISAIGR